MAGSMSVASDTGSLQSQPLRAERLARVKSSYTTRFVARWMETDPEGFSLATGGDLRPRPGDVVLARVVEVGQHTRIEMPDSRRALLFPGDEVAVAYGNRYAPDQFEAEVPSDLGVTHLVAAGGLAGTMLSRHADVDDPTVIEPLGLLCHSGEVVHLTRCAPYRVVDLPADLNRGAVPVVAVVGTSMNSGKSTTAGALIRGLTAAGLDVAAGKVTGTGAGGDARLFGDSGAASVVDFTDFGYSSTYRLPHGEVRGLLRAMTSVLCAGTPDVVVLEVADGVFQQETSRLLDDPLFSQLVDAVVFASADATGAYAGTRLLSELGLTVCAVSGVLTSSPLATREATLAVDVPVVVTDDLARAETARSLLAGIVPAATEGADERPSRW